MSGICPNFRFKPPVFAVSRPHHGLMLVVTTGRMSRCWGGLLHMAGSIIVPGLETTETTSQVRKRDKVTECLCSPRG